MTEAEHVETTERVHENHKGWSEVPPQTYLAEISVGRGWHDFRVNARLNKMDSESDFSTSLPPWMWDQVDWDEVREGSYGTTFGKLTLGPTVPDEAGYQARKAVEQAQRIVEVRRDHDLVYDEPHLMLDDFQEFAGNVESWARTLARVEEGKERPQDALGEDRKEDLAHALRAMSDLVHSLRCWLYEEHGVEV